MEYLENNKYVVPTVDTIVVNDADEVLLVLRHKEPSKGKWVLPGGRIDVEDMSAPVAAVREVQEETGLDVEITSFMGVYADPTRDSRFHAVSTVYVGSVVGGKIQVQEGETDAVQFFSLDQLPDIGFDHKHIIEEYIAGREKGCLPAYDDRTLSVYGKEWQAEGYQAKAEYIHVAVDTIVRNTEGKILWTYRAKRWCTNTWILPGGHMKVGEDIAETSAREVWEEAGVKITFDRVLATLYGPYRNPHHPALTVLCVATLTEEAPFAENIEVLKRQWASIEETPDPIGFDCEKMMTYYQLYLRSN
ncbi:NUDIX domain-containing protein [Patescibacteria group bacterium]|nr:NUDIX domain-containing protein [Patescibacteria group bacterium]MBU1721726.1 NUDIX domain-containing protein [Patescibacteria group bacterium]MBU1901438.1 NUDIX domain-containing protein [Patescibacteria group bacterium]